MCLARKKLVSLAIAKVHLECRDKMDSRLRGNDGKRIVTLAEAGVHLGIRR
jgi:hypothetical protein